MLHLVGSRKRCRVKLPMDNLVALDNPNNHLHKATYLVSTEELSQLHKAPYLVAWEELNQLHKQPVVVSLEEHNQLHKQPVVVALAKLCQTAYNRLRIP